MQIVEFKTAQLAKEVGYGINPYIQLHRYYDIEANKLVAEPMVYKRDISTSPYGKLSLDQIEVGITPGIDQSFDSIILAPYQSELQKWLRDSYNIHIEINRFCNSTKVTPDGKNFRLDIGRMITHEDGTETWDEKVSMKIMYFSNYEEALEKGLCKGLEILKEK